MRRGDVGKQGRGGKGRSGKSEEEIKGSLIFRG